MNQPPHIQGHELRSPANGRRTEGCRKAAETSRLRPSHTINSAVNRGFLFARYRLKDNSEGVDRAGTYRITVRWGLG